MVGETSSQVQHGSAEAELKQVLPYCVDKGVIIKGLSASFLLKHVPGMQLIVDECVTSAAAKHDATTQGLMAQQRGKGLRLISTTVQQASQNLLTTLGQFFWLMERLKPVGFRTLSLEMVLNPSCLRCFGHFLLHSHRSP